MRVLFAVLLLVLSVSPGFAVEPGEVLDDPVLEARARKISKGLRCVVCQNQSIDSSDADLAGAMRVLVRERLVAGDSNVEVNNYMVSRYGDFVLLKPPLKKSTYVLWFGPLLIIGLGILTLIIFYRRRRSLVAATPEGLSDEERRRLETLLKDEE